MKTVVRKLEIELTYDRDTMHGDDEESKRWFSEILLNTPLFLHSNEIGDSVGNVKITKFISGEPLYSCILCGEEEPCSHNKEW